MKKTLLALLVATYGIAYATECDDLFKESKYDAAFPICSNLADSGSDSDAMFYVGVMYRTGQGVEKDDKMVLKWYQKSAELGNSNAMYDLGVMYGSGRGVEKDNKKAVKWYQKSADLGNSNAMDWLGAMYYIGQGVEKNDKVAMKWFQKSAELGNSNAMYNLGVMYSNGRGVKKNDKEAIKWYQKASDLGNSSAQNYLKSVADAEEELARTKAQTLLKAKFDKHMNQCKMIVKNINTRNTTAAEFISIGYNGTSVDGDYFRYCQMEIRKKCSELRLAEQTTSIGRKNCSTTLDNLSSWMYHNYIR